MGNTALGYEPLLKTNMPSICVTFGGSALRKATVGFLEDWPADANSRVAGSLMVVRDQRSGERPPFARTLLDWAAMPFFGFPYLLT